MNKAELIEEIKKVCKVRNDIKIKMVVTGEDWSLDAKYVFLSEAPRLSPFPVPRN